MPAPTPTGGVRLKCHLSQRRRKLRGHILSDGVVLPFILSRYLIFSVTPFLFRAIASLMIVTASILPSDKIPWYFAAMVSGGGLVTHSMCRLLFQWDTGALFSLESACLAYLLAVLFDQIKGDGGVLRIPETQFIKLVELIAIRRCAPSSLLLLVTIVFGAVFLRLSKEAYMRFLRSETLTMMAFFLLLRALKDPSPAATLGISGALFLWYRVFPMQLDRISPATEGDHDVDTAGGPSNLVGSLSAPVMVSAVMDLTIHILIAERESVADSVLSYHLVFRLLALGMGTLALMRAVTSANAAGTGIPVGFFKTLMGSEIIIMAFNFAQLLHI